MKIVETQSALRSTVREWKAKGYSIALVPTMGYLHEGHLSLVDLARQRADRVVVSIFVNPLQFGPTEDFERYPRDLERDHRLLGSRGVDLVYQPAPGEMYRKGAAVRIEPGALGERWEGAVRPGHFRGVLTVVGKLFHQVGPDLACFGQKDVQQVTLIRRMVEDLDWPVELVTGKTIREPDGLALSSRNVYLSPSERRAAVAVPTALRQVQAAWRAGETAVDRLERIAESLLSPLGPVDYIGLVRPDDLEPASIAAADTIVMIAVRVGKTRLIDNVVLGEPV